MALEGAADMMRQAGACRLVLPLLTADEVLRLSAEARRRRGEGMMITKTDRAGTKSVSV